jgi:hypothetical protein
LLLHPAWNGVVEGLNSRVVLACREHLIDLGRCASAFDQEDEEGSYDKRGITYNYLDPGVRRTHGIEHHCVRPDDAPDVPLAEVDIVGAEHELNDIGLGVLNPARDIVPGNIVRLPARVSLMIWIETLRPRALRLEGVHGADEVDTVR